MAISLSRLFADSERMYGIKLIAGKKGLKSLVRWVHIIEDAEVTGFIHGNELVFTTGIVHRDNQWIYDFVLNLREKGAVGLVLNLGPYIKDVPPEVIKHCNKNDFPLFTIPWDKRLIDVTYDYCHRIIANEEHEAGLASAFRNLIFNPVNEEAYIHTLSRRGFQQTSNYTLMVVKALKNDEVIPADKWHESRFELQAVLNSIDKPMFMFVQQNTFVIVGIDFENEKIDNYLSVLVEELKRKLYATDVYIGVSNSNLGYNGVPLCYNQALTAVKIGMQHNKTIVHYGDTGLYKIVYSVENRKVIEEYYNSYLKSIVHHDKINNTDYLNTLECYLKNDCSVQAVSQIMNVHRNTVNYKIKFLKKNFNLSFTNKNIAELLTAFICKDILEK